VIAEHSSAGESQPYWANMQPLSQQPAHLFNYQAGYTNRVPRTAISLVDETNALRIVTSNWFTADTKRSTTPVALHESVIKSRSSSDDVFILSTSPYRCELYTSHCTLLCEKYELPPRVVTRRVEYKHTSKSILRIKLHYSTVALVQPMSATDVRRDTYSQG